MWLILLHVQAAWRVLSYPAAFLAGGQGTWSFGCPGRLVRQERWLTGGDGRRAPSEIMPGRQQADTLLRNDRVIIDEVGLAPLDDTGAQLLFRVVAAAYERRALGIASHWPFDKAHMFAATCARRHLN
jgi:hypothetical protein